MKASITYTKNLNTISIVRKKTHIKTDLMIHERARTQIHRIRNSVSP
jgi:hypothetical protein